MTTLPRGIVALVMTDVEGSTQAWNRSATAMEEAMAALDADIATLVEANHGSIVKARGEGDSHFGAFASATDAVAAAAALQRRPDHRLDVRAAVFVAEVEPRRGDYLGPGMKHGAHVRSAAHGGQVLVTRAVVDLATVAPDDDLSFRSLGVHQLRDVPAPIELYQLHGSGLAVAFPPLHTTAHDASSVMAVVIVDEVAASRRFGGAADEVIAWQRELIQALRSGSERHDGRFLKLVGDGCIVGFEDPRQALDFAEDLPDGFRAGIALGLVEVVEGELVGRPVYDAHQLVRGAGAGEVRCCPVTESVCAPPLIASFDTALTRV